MNYFDDYLNGNVVITKLNTSKKVYQKKPTSESPGKNGSFFLAFPDNTGSTRQSSADSGARRRCHATQMTLDITFTRAK